MMDEDTLAQRLMATFLEELHDRVGDMNRDLLILEKRPNGPGRDEALKVLFRSAHSLKGAARAVGVVPIESACHRMEDILATLRNGREEVDSSLISLLLEVADAVAEVGTRLRSEQSLSDASLHALLPRLERVAQEYALLDPSAPPADEQSLSEKEGGWASPPPPPDAFPPDATSDLREASHQQAAATIRVSADKLDSLLAQTGELLIARRKVEFRVDQAASLADSATVLKNEWRDLESKLRTTLNGDRPTLLESVNPRRMLSLLERTGKQIDDVTTRLDHLSSNMTVDSRILSQTCGSLDDEIYRVRMLPYAEACSGLERMVRDLARAEGKEVALEIRGADIEADRAVLEGLRDPLMHLVRNAVNHGIESPLERQAANKPTQGRVTVSAALHGGQVEVVVADDGRGFELERIREKARELGRMVPDDDRDVARLVFAPGFSTTQRVTDVSGRGVGLDVVQSQIEALHGAMEVVFTAGQGTRFTMTVPLTLTTIRCMLAVTGGRTFAIPTTHVQQIVRFDSSRLKSIGGHEMLLVDREPIPVVGLASALGQEERLREEPKMLAIVVSAGTQTVAFVVDELSADQDILVKGMGKRIRRVRHVSGATLLPSGEVALVLSVPNVIRTALGASPKRRIGIKIPAAGAERRRILAVDDSVTTRTLLRNILESSGFDVVTAVDGQQAWDLLQEQSFDVVVSDVDMPNVNGFDLTEMIRGSTECAQLPIILITARGSDEDKSRGLRVGANAYIAKSGFDQGNLLEVLEQLT